jgi:fatty acid desaturase
MNAVVARGDRRVAVEWPTLGLIVLVYAVLAALVWHHGRLPWWIILIVGGYATALQVSLQHEVLHGHPTRHRRLNEVLVFVSPHFWMPYQRYRATHLRHHDDRHLTDPSLDPESSYLLPDSWARLSAPLRQIYTLNNTLAGRMLLGPMIGIVRIWGGDLLAIARGDREIARAWLLHLLGSGIWLGYVVAVCGMPLAQYLALIAYPAISLSLVRSFCEHQAAADLGERTVVVEAAPGWSLLFLNNNLHVAHHTRPALAWYRLPAYYRAERAALIARNRGYVIHGYGEIFRRYLVRAKEPVAYPDPAWLEQA